jgi:hypothetical protein
MIAAAGDVDIEDIVDLQARRLRLIVETLSQVRTLA